MDRGNNGGISDKARNIFEDVGLYDSLDRYHDNNEQQSKDNAFSSANSALTNALSLSKDYGVAPMIKKQEENKKGSVTQKSLTGWQADPKTKMPTHPGFAYMTHLFNLNDGTDEEKKNAKKRREDVYVFTDQPEALKTAISLMGIQSDKNPGGVPIDFNEAMKAYFGDDDELDDVAINQWKTNVEQGDATIDPKRVRKFTNYDGSVTWEVLNEDKTVANRFTIGSYGNKKVFAQGGYKKFVDLIKKAEDELGPDDSKAFDAIRRMQLRRT